MFTPSTPLKAQLWAGDGGLERITVSITQNRAKTGTSTQLPG